MACHHAPNSHHIAHRPAAINISKSGVSMGRYGALQVLQSTTGGQGLLMKIPCGRKILNGHSTGTKQDAAWTGVMRLSVGAIMSTTSVHYKEHDFRNVVLQLLLTFLLSNF